MKILAQHGHQPEQKVNRGLKERIIDGVILSARYAAPDRARAAVNEARLMRSDAEILLDPEFYAIPLIGTPNSQLGSLPAWPHFMGQKRRELIRERAVLSVLEKAKEATLNMEVSAYIAPGVF